MSEAVVLPKHLVTDSEAGQEKVPVDTTVKIACSPEDVDRLQKHLGHFQISGARLAAMHDLGLNAEQMGFLRTLKGGIILSADSVLQTIARLGLVVEDADTKMADRLKAASVIATLTNSFSKLAQGAVRSERDVAEVHIARDEQKRNSFRPGIGANPIPV
jgi:hypothetical protein